MPRHNSTFTPKEERLIAEYVIDGNGTRAAIAAGYSARSARNTAQEVLARPHVKAEVKRRQRGLVKKLEITAEKVLGDIARVAGKAERARQYNASIRGHQLLGQHLKLFTEKHEHGGIGGGPIQMTVTESDAAL